MKFDNCLVNHGNNPCNCGGADNDARNPYKQTIDDLRNQQLDSIRLLQNRNLKMTTEHEETEKLRPCPFCGKIETLHYSQGRVTCDECIGMVADWIDQENFQSAHCWKLLDEKDEKIKELQEEIWIKEQLWVPIHNISGSGWDKLHEAEEKIRRLREVLNMYYLEFPQSRVAKNVLDETNPENRESDK